MPLGYDAPNEGLAVELQEVARDAAILLAALGEGNAPLPASFPRPQVEAICRSLIDLPAGTAEGCRAPLEYARNRLPAIRRDHIKIDDNGMPATSDDEPPPVYRGMSVDLAMRGALASIMTALDEYRRQSGEAGDDRLAVEGTIDTTGMVAVDDAIAHADASAGHLQAARYELKTIARPDSVRADSVQRTLQDAATSTRLGAAELAMRSVVSRWYRGTLDALRNYPQMLRRGIEALETGTDIAKIALERWHEFQHHSIAFVIEELTKTLAAMRGALEVIESRRRQRGKVPNPIPDLHIFRDRLADDSLGPEMVVIPASSFLMGSPEDEEGRSGNEGPQHSVSVSRFASGRHPVTFEEYDRYCTATGVEKPRDDGWGRGRRPVIYVSWDDAKAYCAWLSGETGKEYHLPSEAEWENACRAGTVTLYSWGDQEPDATLANFDGNVGKTTEVGSYPANAWKLHDLHGNVWEWCDDAWHASYADAPSDSRARVREEGTERVLRGGSWYDDAQDVRSACRSADDPRSRGGTVGFRLARVQE